MRAVLSGKLRAVELLLRAGADTSIGEKDGYTPLHGAGFQGRAAIATRPQGLDRARAQSIRQARRWLHATPPCMLGPRAAAHRHGARAARRGRQTYREDDSASGQRIFAKLHQQHDEAAGEGRETRYLLVLLERHHKLEQLRAPGKSCDEPCEYVWMLVASSCVSNTKESDHDSIILYTADKRRVRGNS